MVRHKIIAISLTVFFGASSAIADTWVAFAGGTGKLNSGRLYAASGIGFGDTQRQAVDKAMAACNKKGCRFVTAFTYGCYYITTGNNGYGGVAVGFGLTPQAAIYGAQSYGATTVNRPNGGCMNEYGQFFQY